MTQNGAPQNMQDRIFGSIAPNGDTFNWQWRTERIVLPIDLRPSIEKAEYQGYANTCSGEAVSGACETFLLSRGVYCPPLSATFPYRNAKMRTAYGTPLVDDGASSQVLLAEATISGLCMEGLHDYYHGVLSDPSASAVADGASRLLDSYATIAATKTVGWPTYQAVYQRALWADMKVALACKMPVVLGVPLHQSFANITGPLETHPAQWLNGVRGQLMDHYMYAVGMFVLPTGEEAIIIANSHGSWWGDNGCFAMTRSQFEGCGVYGTFAITGFAGVKGEIPMELYRWDAGTVEGQAHRLYRFALGRHPDKGGLIFQAAAIAATDLGTVAQQFMASPEFQSRFVVPDDAAFIRLLYTNGLGRQPAQSEVDWYLARGMSRVAMLIGFSESPENQAA